MGSFTSDIDAIIKSKAGSDLNNNGAIPSKGHLVRSLPEKELENNELTLIKEKLETLEMKNEQLTAYVNFLYQLISQLQTTLGESQPGTKQTWAIKGDVALQYLEIKDKN